METQFTPWASLIGGFLIGLAAALFWIGNGRIAGISGILSRLLPPFTDGEFSVRASFILGLLVAPLLFTAWTRQAFPVFVEGGPLLIALAGLLVGLGTVIGNGCTSGHGVCGVARISKRSIAATLTFMGAAMLTVAIVRYGFGG